MKQKISEHRNVVSGRVTYTCGRCSNIQVRRYVARDGLLELPTYFCGCCAKSNNFVTMSAVISEVKCEAPNVETKEGGLGGRPEMPAPEPAAGTTEQSAEGRIDSDVPKVENKDAGKGRAEILPPVVKKPQDKGR
jgi:hypothetical protein